MENINRKIITLMSLGIGSTAFIPQIMHAWPSLQLPWSPHATENPYAKVTPMEQINLENLHLFADVADESSRAFIIVTPDGKPAYLRYAKSFDPFQCHCYVIPSKLFAKLADPAVCKTMFENFMEVWSEIRMRIDDVKSNLQESFGIDKASSKTVIVLQDKDDPTVLVAVDSMNNRAVEIVPEDLIGNVYWINLPHGIYTKLMNNYEVYPRNSTPRIKFDFMTSQWKFVKSSGEEIVLPRNFGNMEIKKLRLQDATVSGAKAVGRGVASAGIAIGSAALQAGRLVKDTAVSGAEAVGNAALQTGRFVKDTAVSGVNATVSGAKAVGNAALQAGRLVKDTAVSGAEAVGSAALQTGRFVKDTAVSGAKAVGKGVDGAKSKARAAKRRIKDALGKGISDVGSKIHEIGENMIDHEGMDYTDSSGNQVMQEFGESTVINVGSKIHEIGENMIDHEGMDYTDSSGNQVMQEFGESTIIPENISYINSKELNGTTNMGREIEESNIEIPTEVPLYKKPKANYMGLSPETPISPIINQLKQNANRQPNNIIRQGYNEPSEWHSPRYPMEMINR
ncbi:MAG: hypothetical protein LBS71_02235 [Puniceicoccales bacterium]|jgi:hypothetical protein|nr:hypothetical protein [Puniceicoccales bacterium]